MSEQSVPEILDALRSAVMFEQQERMDAPIDAKAAADARIEAATRQKLSLIKAAFDRGATKVAIAQNLGIQNLGHVTKLIKRAEEL